MDEAAWQREQREVWGDGDAWSKVIHRLRDWDTALQARVTLGVQRRRADDVLSGVLDIMFPPEVEHEPANIRARQRVERLRAGILERIQGVMDNGMPPHLVARTACDCVLRGMPPEDDEDVDSGATQA